MRDRQTTLSWIKDLIEHMRECHEQMQWAGEGAAGAFLADALIADLSECRRLCDRLKSVRQGRDDAGKVASAGRSHRVVAAKG